MIEAEIASHSVHDHSSGGKRISFNIRSEFIPVPAEVNRLFTKSKRAIEALLTPAEVALLREWHSHPIFYEPVPKFAPDFTPIEAYEIRRICFARALDLSPSSWGGAFVHDSWLFAGNGWRGLSVVVLPEKKRG